MYYQNQFSEVSNSPGEIWNLINSMLYNKNVYKTSPNKIENANNTIQDPKQIDEQFNTHFCQIGKKALW